MKAPWTAKRDKWDGAFSGVRTAKEHHEQGPMATDQCCPERDGCNVGREMFEEAAIDAGCCYWCRELCDVLPISFPRQKVGRKEKRQER